MALILSGSSANATLDSSAGLTFSDSSNQSAAASPYVLKNRIINGAMVIDQRNNGAAQTITAGTYPYTVDRWFASSTGANVTGQRVAGTNSNTYNYQFTGAAGTTLIGFNQRIESYNIADLAGTTVTLSANFANTLLTTVYWQTTYPSAQDNYTSSTTFASGSFTVSSTLTKYSTQIALPSGAANGLMIQIYVLAQTSGTWTIGNVQLEIGSSATPFERRLYNQELANCQRYLPSSGTTSNYYAGVSTSTTNAYAPIPLPVPARVAPTGITIASGTYYWLNGSGTQNTATVVFNSAGYQGAMVQITTTGATLGQAGLFNPNGATILFTGCEL